MEQKLVGHRAINLDSALLCFYTRQIIPLFRCARSILFSARIRHRYLVNPTAEWTGSDFRVFADPLVDEVSQSAQSKAKPKAAFAFEVAGSRTVDGSVGHVNSIAVWPLPEQSKPSPPILPFYARHRSFPYPGPYKSRSGHSNSDAGPMFRCIVYSDRPLQRPESNFAERFWKAGRNTCCNTIDLLINRLETCKVVGDGRNVKPPDSAPFRTL